MMAFKFYYFDIGGDRFIVRDNDYDPANTERVSNSLSVFWINLFRLNIYSQRLGLWSSYSRVIYDIVDNDGIEKSLSQIIEIIEKYCKEIGVTLDRVGIVRKIFEPDVETIQFYLYEYALIRYRGCSPSIQLKDQLQMWLNGRWVEAHDPQTIIERGRRITEEEAVAIAKARPLNNLPDDDFFNKLVRE